MRRIILFFVVGLIVAGAFASRFSFADQEKRGRSYEITITNLTRGQIFSPPIVISHNNGFQLFTLGDLAPDELVALAEDGNTMPLTDLIDSGAFPSVYDYDVAGGAVLPGDSVTLEVKTLGRFRYISAAGMLITTNDAFFAIRNVSVPKWGKVITEAAAYDAGSEANSENCAFIPGCGGGGVHDPSTSEGYVHIHAGIHGIADLIPESDDWRNPVAEIRIRPLHR